MIEKGAQAPGFELPAVRDGDVERVALSSHLGDGVIILAFYPGDFNPACDDNSTALDELDLFTMQKDVTVLGISADSVYSHRAFAAEYSLDIPLLSDTRGVVAGAYGVAVEADNPHHLTKRAVVVIGPGETIEYTWLAGDVETLPEVEEVRAAIEAISGDETAMARYRVGHAHYIEGRRAFTSAMEGFEEKEWMLAGGDFDQARAEFETAHDEFNTAVRFVEDERNRSCFERAERKAEALWRASGWLGDSASAFASGEGATGDSMRRDAETPLETARGIDDPPAPGDLPPDGPDQPDTGPAGPTDKGDASLEVNFDQVEPADGTGEPPAGSSEEDSGPTGEESATAWDTDEEATGSGSGEGETGSASDQESAADEIDEAELEEITAELEQQTEAASQEPSTETDPGGGSVVPRSIDLEPVDGTEGDGTGSGGETEGDDTEPDDEATLDLSESDDDSEDSGSGNHGVPDSL